MKTENQTCYETAEQNLFTRFETETQGAFLAALFRAFVRPSGLRHGGGRQILMLIYVTHTVTLTGSKLSALLEIILQGTRRNHPRWQQSARWKHKPVHPGNPNHGGTCRIRNPMNANLKNSETPVLAVGQIDGETFQAELFPQAQIVLCYSPSPDNILSIVDTERQAKPHCCPITDPALVVHSAHTLALCGSAILFRQGSRPKSYRIANSQRRALRLLRRFVAAGITPSEAPA